MKSWNRIKLTLDAVMLAVLLLMYNKNTLGMGFHEIAGLAVCGLFIVHILLNGKWVLVVTGKLFSPKVAWRSKVNWLVDVLLLLCFAYILVSGIFISRVVFAGQRGASLFKTGHYAVSALALSLLGIHLGLHYAGLARRAKVCRLPLLLRRVTAVVLSAAILGFGVYQMTATSFVHWMGSLGSVVGAALPEGGEIALPALQDEAELPDAGELHAEPEGTGGGHGNGRGNGGTGQGNGNGNGREVAADPSIIGSVLLRFLSITLAFAVVAAWIDGAARCRKCKKLLA